jgi:CheY-like chemotaxis protein
VLILDLQMPALDGFEVLRRIKLSPDRRSMVVIAMSGHMDRAKMERCKKLGATRCLQKPVGASDLVGTLRELRKPRDAWSR